MPLSRFIELLVLLPRRTKKLVVLSLDIFLCFITAWIALCLRFDKLSLFTNEVIFVGSISAILILPIFIIFGLYRSIFRYGGWFAALSLIKSISIYLVLFATLFLFTGIDGIPRSIGVLQPILLFIGVGATRLIAKHTLNGVAQLRQSSRKGIALIYGAGSAGRQLSSGLRQSCDIKIIGFIDDDSQLWGGIVNGILVYSPAEVSKLIALKGVTDILLAIPSATRARQKEILMNLSNLPLRVRTLPSLSTLATGVVKIEDIRDVGIDDLLGREPVQANTDLLHQNITSKVVMVTGAGGSIGSELCRQILMHQPKSLVLFELNEFALYAIEREFELHKQFINIIPVLGSVLDYNKLSRVFSRFGVQTVFHAAAYKHVPMIEMNPSAGVWNNVFGTLRTVEAACHFGVETFVLISTDKAVRPTNVMGCSKRLAELVLQAKSALASQSGMHATKLTMVRFGNVLGSSGSVVPLFREQIKNGGPVTVTHPEIVRYFMTIPEAAQLVIQAGAMGEGGDVMVLDMGGAVKIVDLAKRMIHLSGFSHKDESNPDGDIEIQFTGLRPGEKLYEELLIGDNTMPTLHKRIMRAMEDNLSWIELKECLVELELAIKADDSDAILKLLKKVVPEFNPQIPNKDVLSIS